MMRDSFEMTDTFELIDMVIDSFEMTDEEVRLVFGNGFNAEKKKNLLPEHRRPVATTSTLGSEATCIANGDSSRRVEDEELLRRIRRTAYQDPLGDFCCGDFPPPDEIDIFKDFDFADGSGGATAVIGCTSATQPVVTPTASSAQTLCSEATCFANGGYFRQVEDDELLRLTKRTAFQDPPACLCYGDFPQLDELDNFKDFDFADGSGGADTGIDGTSDTQPVLSPTTSSAQTLGSEATCNTNGDSFRQVEDEELLRLTKRTAFQHPLGGFYCEDLPPPDELEKFKDFDFADGSGGDNAVIDSISGTQLPTSLTASSARKSVTILDPSISNKSGGTLSGVDLGAKAVPKKWLIEKQLVPAKHSGDIFRGKISRKTCRHDGCANSVVQGRRVCIQHGARQIKKRCNHEGCTKYAQRGGVCRKHGAKVKMCIHEGCINQSVKDGVCRKHGALPKICSSYGCTNEARELGVCYTHGATRRSCGYEGCSNFAHTGGVCWRHGAKCIVKSRKLAKASLQDRR